MLNPKSLVHKVWLSHKPSTEQALEVTENYDLVDKILKVELRKQRGKARLLLDGKEISLNSREDHYTMERPLREAELFTVQQDLRNWYGQSSRLLRSRQLHKLIIHPPYPNLYMQILVGANTGQSLPLIYSNYPFSFLSSSDNNAPRAQILLGLSVPAQSRVETLFSQEVPGFTYTVEAKYHISSTSYLSQAPFVAQEADQLSGKSQILIGRSQFSRFGLPLEVEVLEASNWKLQRYLLLHFTLTEAGH